MFSKFSDPGEEYLTGPANPLVPRWPSRAPRSPQGAPGAPKSFPRGPREAPERPPRDPRKPEKASKRPPRGIQEDTDPQPRLGGGMCRKSLDSKPRYMPKLSVLRLGGAGLRPSPRHLRRSLLSTPFVQNPCWDQWLCERRPIRRT